MNVNRAIKIANTGKAKTVATQTKKHAKHNTVGLRDLNVLTLFQTTNSKDRIRLLSLHFSYKNTANKSGKVGRSVSVTALPRQQATVCIPVVITAAEGGACQFANW